MEFILRFYLFIFISAIFLFFFPISIEKKKWWIKWKIPSNPFLFPPFSPQLNNWSFFFPLPFPTHFSRISLITSNKHGIKVLGFFIWDIYVWKFLFCTFMFDSVFCLILYAWLSFLFGFHENENFKT